MVVQQRASYYQQIFNSGFQNFESKSPLIVDGVIHQISSDLLKRLVNFDVSEARLDLIKALKIGEGSFSQILKCPIVCKTPTGVEKMVDIVLKVPIDNDAMFPLLKESFLGERALNCLNVASGIFLIHQNQFYLFEQFHQFDGSRLSELTLKNSLTQETTIGILAEVLKGCVQLEDLDIFHVDIKPGNTLGDGIVNVDDPFSEPIHMHLSDLGGAFCFPQFDELTSDFLRKQLLFFSKSENRQIKRFIFMMSPKIENFDLREKLYFLIFCQTGGLFSCGSTKNFSSLALEEAINDCFNFFLLEYYNKLCDEDQIRQKYERMKELLSSQMVFQLAATYLCLINFQLYFNLCKFRKEGVVEKGGFIPFSETNIKKTLCDADVVDSRIVTLIYQMLQTEKFPRTVKSCYSQFSKINELDESPNSEEE